MEGFRHKDDTLEFVGVSGSWYLRFARCFLSVCTRPSPLGGNTHAIKLGIPSSGRLVMSRPCRIELGRVAFGA